MATSYEGLIGDAQGKTFTLTLSTWKHGKVTL